MNFFVNNWFYCRLALEPMMICRKWRKWLTWSFRNSGWIIV